MQLEDCSSIRNKKIRPGLSGCLAPDRVEVLLSSSMRSRSTRRRHGLAVLPLLELRSCQGEKNKEKVNYISTGLTRTTTIQS